MSVHFYPLPKMNKSFAWPETPSDWTYQRLIADPAIVTGWVSFDTVTYDAKTGESGSIWCGLNVLDPTDVSILWRFDIHSSEFTPVDLSAYLTPHDVKIHKGLTLADDRLIFATASFIDPPQQADFDGGKLFVYNTSKDEVEVCVVPVGPENGFPILGQYIQSTLVSNDRVYGCTYPLEILFEYDLNAKRTNFLAHLQGTDIGQPHTFAQDPKGRIWGTFGIRNGWSYAPNLYPVRPFYYDPASRAITWLESHCLPRQDPSDAPGSDAVVCWGDWVYFADKGGNLSRIHVDSLALEYLGKLTSNGRCPVLIHAEDRLWAAAGEYGDVKLLQVCPDGSIETVAKVVTANGEAPERLHDLAYVGGGRFFAGENDNHRRSSYLWEIVL